MPGGNAPLNRLTRMVGAMAVKNLELTYLGKPLHQLAEEDFADLAGLLEQCKEVDSKLAAFQVPSFEGSYRRRQNDTGGQPGMV